MELCGALLQVKRAFSSTTLLWAWFITWWSWIVIAFFSFSICTFGICGGPGTMGKSYLTKVVWLGSDTGPPRVWSACMTSLILPLHAQHFLQGPQPCKTSSGRLSMQPWRMKSADSVSHSVSFSSCAPGGGELHIAFVLACFLALQDLCKAHSL